MIGTGKRSAIPGRVGMGIVQQCHSRSDEVRVPDSRGLRREPRHTV